MMTSVLAVVTIAFGLRADDFDERGSRLLRRALARLNACEDAVNPRLAEPTDLQRARVYLPEMTADHVAEIWFAFGSGPSQRVALDDELRFLSPELSSVDFVELTYGSGPRVRLKLGGRDLLQRPMSPVPRGWFARLFRRFQGNALALSGLVSDRPALPELKGSVLASISLIEDDQEIALKILPAAPFELEGLRELTFRSGGYALRYVLTPRLGGG